MDMVCEAELSSVRTDAGVRRHAARRLARVHPVRAALDLATRTAGRPTRPACAWCGSGRPDSPAAGQPAGLRPARAAARLPGPAGRGGRAGRGVRRRRPPTRRPAQPATSAARTPCAPTAWRSPASPDRTSGRPDGSGTDARGAGTGAVAAGGRARRWTVMPPAGWEPGPTLDERARRAGPQARSRSAVARRRPGTSTSRPDVRRPSGGTARRATAARSGGRTVDRDPAGQESSGAFHTSVRFMPAARPLAEITSAILRDASSIISSPSMTAPLAPPFSEVKYS